MTRDTYIFCCLVLGLSGLAGCSREAPKQAAAPPDKIRGKAQVLLTETTALDTSLNGGGPSVYLIDGLNRYRLFFDKSSPVEPGKEYIAEGVYAQKAIDAIGDPDKGKNGYPLESSCDTVVRRAWPALDFNVVDSYSTSLRNKVKRFPARPVFLVDRIQPVTGADAAKPGEDAGADKPEAEQISVPSEKQSALLDKGPTVLTAPLWEPTGETVRCKVVIDQEGKIAELDSGTELCESVPWSQFRYRPTVKSGHPVKVNTEVEIRFDPQK